MLVMCLTWKWLFVVHGAVVLLTLALCAVTQFRHAPRRGGKHVRAGGTRAGAHHGGQADQGHVALQVVLLLQGLHHRLSGVGHHSSCL